MRKIYLSLSLSILLTGVASAEDKKDVRVYNWSDYIEESLLKEFKEMTGYGVTYDVFDSNEILETKLLAGSSGYDVVVPSHSFLQRQVQAGAFQKLDKSKIPNSKHTWDVIEKRVAPFDPDNAYSINYLWGTTGIGLNVAKVKEALGDDAPLSSLKLIFDAKNMEKLSKCGVYFLDAPTEMIPAALAYIGEDPNSHDPDVIAKAEAVFMNVRPFVKKFDSSEYITALANGEICVAVGFSGDVLQSRDRASEAKNGVTVAYNAVSEGSQMWFDQMAIPADAPNAEGAHAFINFMLDPENSAKITNYVNYASGNITAQKHIDKDILADQAIYPSEETMKNLYVTTPYPQKVLRKVNRLWTKVKSGT